MKNTISLLLSVLLITTVLAKPIYSMEYLTDFDIAVSQARESEKNLLIIFSTDGCVYCEKLKSALPQIDETEHFIVCILDSTEYKKMIRRNNIRRWPTSLIIDASSDTYKEIDRIIGFQSVQTYSDWLKSSR